MSATDRYMCLACGRFWRSEQRPDHCPHCTDKYYVDNVILDAPTPPHEHVFACSCGNIQTIDFPGDMTNCCVCGNKVVAVGKEQLTLHNQQLKQLEELGI